jgi:chitodextrinase
MTPSNGSTNIPISTSSISLIIRDPEGKSFNYTIQTRPNIGTSSVKRAYNGTKQCTISGLAYSTTYRWYVNATDGVNWMRRWYIFTTQHDPLNNPVVFSGVTPGNAFVGVPLSTSSLVVIIRDAEGDAFNWRITTSPNIGSHSGNNEFNGSKICRISGLASSTTYHWYVTCRDTGSGRWTNRSYWFTTEDESSGGGSPSSGGGGESSPGGNGSSSTPPPNNPPSSPLKPLGPTFIERGVNYTYTSSAIDPDGDQVRLRFDWGDGSFSNWSVLADSNTNVSSSHAWSYLSNYSIRVIAQDKNGSNSSWSTLLTVTVSEQETSNEPPILDIKAPNNGSANQTIVFDASGSIDPDGIIISYVWDFGDGTTGTGKTLDHSYTKPGIYLVTLTVTDNIGKTYTKTFQVTIDAYAEATVNTASSPFSSLSTVLIFIVCAIIIGMVFFFSKKIRDVLSSKSTVHHMEKIEQLNAKNAKLAQNFSTKPNYKKNMMKEQKHTELYDNSLEEQIDRVLVSRIEEKIDKL